MIETLAGIVTPVLGFFHDHPVLTCATALAEVVTAYAGFRWVSRGAR